MSITYKYKNRYMKKLFEALTKDKSIFVNDFDGWGSEALPEGFKWGKGGMEENAILAPNGDLLIFQSTSLRRGNHLEVSLRDKGTEVEKIKLGDFFPDQDVVIATSGESLMFFAPICKDKRELIHFLGSLEEFCGKEQMAYWRFHDMSENLAIWLYRHNPNRKKEREWGI